jgi:hypothetical protein
MNTHFKFAIVAWFFNSCIALGITYLNKSQDSADTERTEAEPTAQVS